MEEGSLPELWATRFGLADVPLFGGENKTGAGIHSVLLDGGHGSFALSVSADSEWSTYTRNWSWASNVPHHVVAREDQVIVTRWDERQPRITAELADVERNLDGFYRALVGDRVRSNRNVVDHMLWVFRRVRSIIADRKLPDIASTPTFLAIVEMATRRADELAHESPGVGEQYVADLPRQAVESLVKDALEPEVLADVGHFLPSLAVRHAGSDIFQEAHFELFQAGKPDMLGYIAPAKSWSVTRGGAHFTPPALARSLVEQTLAKVDLGSRERLTILDPACGSAAFLHEALRALRRLGFNGRLELIGRDISAAAIPMAEFVLRHAIADWSPAGGCTVNVRQSDSLVETVPSADVVLMNPPFIAWPALSQDLRSTMRQVLGDRFRGRGDLSMAFIARAIDALRPGGALGTVMPTSLLSLAAATPWRRDLLDRATLAFIASLGDFGVFQHAHVQVSLMVMRKADRPVGVSNARRSRLNDVQVVVSRNNRDSTGDALRTLRRQGSSASLDEAGVRLFRLGEDHFRRSPVWRLTAPALRRAIARYCETGSAALVHEIFSVHQGIRAGDKAFRLSQEDYGALPTGERSWFRPAVTSDAIGDGRITPRQFVFFPYTEEGPAFREERQLREELPHYFEKHLISVKARLLGRKRVKPDQWWSLAEPRASWAFDSSPRIVSKYFGGVGSFAADLEAGFAVVQGYAWFLNSDETELTEAGAEQWHNMLPSLLEGYATILNSSVFVQLLRAFSPHVAGGQYDLSPRFVNEIPVPNLYVDENNAAQLLADLGSRAHSDQSARLEANDVVAQLYGEILDHL